MSKFLEKINKEGARELYDEILQIMKQSCVEDIPYSEFTKDDFAVALYLNLTETRRLERLLKITKGDSDKNEQPDGVLNES
jgi:dephospho-CoA kinase